MRDLTAKLLSTIHTSIYQTTRGRIGRKLVDNDMLLLTTIGRKTSKPHTVPLLYLRSQDRLVIIASWGGRDYPPHWYLNLTADPHVTVQILGDRFDATAVEADAAEHQIWWPQIVAAYSGYAEYQSRTDRLIPVIFLDREAPAESGRS